MTCMCFSERCVDKLRVRLHLMLFLYSSTEILFVAGAEGNASGEISHVATERSISAVISDI